MFEDRRKTKAAFKRAVTRAGIGVGVSQDQEWATSPIFMLVFSRVLLYESPFMTRKKPFRAGHGQKDRSGYGTDQGSLL